MEGDKERFMAVGMSGYVSKPIRVDALVQALEFCGKSDAASPKEVKMADRNSKTADTLDPAALETLLDVIGGDRAALAELISSFLEEGPALIDRIAQAVAQSNADELRTAAHTLKSSAADFGATTLAGYCRELEAMGNAGKTDGADSLSARAASAFDKARQELQQILNNRV
jgi:HPt (histidine-containing phosphotransfer) domain-containing protein